MSTETLSDVPSATPELVDQIDLKRVFGDYADKLTDEQISTIEGAHKDDPKLYAALTRAAEMHTGKRLDEKPELAWTGEQNDPATDDATGEKVKGFAISARLLALNTYFQERREEKRQIRIDERVANLDASLTDDERKDAIDGIMRSEVKRSRLKKLMLGGAALIGAAAGGYAIWKYGFSTGGAGAVAKEKSDRGIELANSTETRPGNAGRQAMLGRIDNYFDMPDQAENFAAKHHRNDFGPGSLGILNGDKKLAVADFENLVRGNSRVASTYMSELGIGDAPKLPSLHELQNNPGALEQFHEKMRIFGEQLDANPVKRYEMTQDLVELMSSDRVTFGKLVELQPGYASWGINTTNGPIFGTNKGEVFFDTSVGYSGEKVREVFIDGVRQEWYWDPNCDQFCRGTEYVPSAPVVSAPIRAVVEQAPAPAPRAVIERVPEPTPVNHYIPDNSVPEANPGGGNPGGSNPGGGNPGGGNETPVIVPKNEAENFGHNVPDQTKQGGNLAPSGSPESRGSTIRPSMDATPGRSNIPGNDNSPAPGASSGADRPGGGLFGRGQREQAGLSPSPSGGNTGGDTGGAGESTGANSGPVSGDD